MTEKAKVKKEDSRPEIVIITGLSGSGMSSATNAFEDLGFFCVDNLPLTMLSTFSRLVEPDEEGESRIERAALVINIRERGFLSAFDSEMEAVRKRGVKVFVLFLEATNAALQRRFSETRRPHPAETGGGLLKAIQDERAAMEGIRAHADLIIDTSEQSVHTLRQLLIERFRLHTEGTPMRVQVLSFGHKYGSPTQVELMFDVRHLPNPYFVPELKNLSGTDQRIIRYLRSKPEVEETLRRFGELLEYLLPLYKREGKSYVTVSIGCTGGRHRSVMVANSLAQRLRKAGFDAVAVHRDVQKARKPATKRGANKTANAAD
jgi:UPF0042 nucleotide-binding protein